MWSAYFYKNLNLKKNIKIYKNKSHFLNEKEFRIKLHCLNHATREDFGTWPELKTPMKQI